LPEKSPKPVAVDGAECFLGRAVVRALVKRGVPVRAIVAERYADAPEGVEVAVAPIGDREALARALEGAGAVVAARKLLEERPRDGLTFKAVHAERTGRLLEAAAAESSGVERFLYVGIAGIKLDSSDPIAASEREAEGALAKSKVRAVSLRASLVVGPGDGHVSRMAAKARRRSPVTVFVGQGWARSAPITARDFGSCVASVVTGDEFPTDPLSIGGPELLTAMDIQDRLLARYGRNKLKIHIPESVARLGAMVIEKVCSHPPVTRARLAWLLGDLVPDRVTSTKLLGRRPQKFESAFPPPRDAHDPRPAEA
jgi:NADH dehydrogenase